MKKYKDFVNEGISKDLKAMAEKYAQTGEMIKPEWKSLSRNQIGDILAFTAEHFEEENADALEDALRNIGISV